MMEFPVTSELVVFLVFSLILLFFIRPLTLSNLLKKLPSNFRFPNWLIVQGLANHSPLKESAPSDLLMRFKFTFFMLFLNVYTYIFTTDFNGKISPMVLENLGFSYTNFAQHHWFILVTSNFIHFSILHLTANMAMLIAFCGILEFLKGSRFVGIVFLIAMNANVPNGVFLLPTLRLFFPHLWTDTVQYVDVGASLGIIGVLGGIARLLVPPARWFTIGIATVGTIVGAIYTNSLFGFDHVFSLIIGYMVASYLLKKPLPMIKRGDRSV